MEISFILPESQQAYHIGLMLIQAIHEQLSGPRSGRWYPVPGNPFYDRSTPSENRADNYHVKFTGTSKREDIRGGAYQASKPGESPAVRTGRLRQSFNMRVVPTEDGNYKVIVTTNIVYADDLEYGSERVAPRPFVQQAIEKIMPEILKIRKDHFLQIIRKQA